MNVASANILSVVQSLSALRQTLSPEQQVILDSLLIRKLDTDEVVAHGMVNAATSMSVASQVQSIAVNTSVVFEDDVVAHSMEKDQVEKHVVSVVMCRVVFDAERNEYSVIF